MVNASLQDNFLKICAFVFSICRRGQIRVDKQKGHHCTSGVPHQQPKASTLNRASGIFAVGYEITLSSSVARWKCLGMASI